MLTNHGVSEMKLEKPRIKKGHGKWFEFIPKENRELLKGLSKGGTHL